MSKRDDLFVGITIIGKAIVTTGYYAGLAIFGLCLGLGILYLIKATF